MDFAIKTAIEDRAAEAFAFPSEKTMYGGRHIAAGDVVYLFQSENAGGTGLFARGLVTASAQLARRPGLARQTPRVTVAVRRTGLAVRRLGRAELKAYDQWDDGRPETELNFKLYRQATDKIVGVSDGTARFLAGFF